MPAAGFADWLSIRDRDKTLFPYFPDSDRQKLDNRLLGLLSLLRAAEGKTPADQLRQDADAILTDVTIDPSDDPSKPKKPYLIKPGGRLLSEGPSLPQRGLWFAMNRPLLAKDEDLKEEVSAFDSALSAVADLVMRRGRPTSVDMRDLVDALRHYLELRGLGVSPTTPATSAEIPERPKVAIATSTDLAEIIGMEKETKAVSTFLSDYKKKNPYCADGSDPNIRGGRTLYIVEAVWEPLTRWAERKRLRNPGKTPE